MNAQTLLFVLRVQDQATGALGLAGAAVAGMGLAIAAASVVATKAAVDFDRSFTRMQTLAGVTAGEVVKITAAVKDMALDTGRAPQDLADALYFISSSGFKTAEAMVALEATAKGSAIGLGATAVVADVVTSAMNSYGHANLGAAEATGIMAKAVQLGKIESDQLAISIGQVIPNASMAGVSFNEAAAALAGMSLSGINAARGATMVRQTLQDIIAPSDTARKHLFDMGIKLEDVQKIFRDQGYLQGIQFLRDNLGELDLRKVVNDAEAFTGIMALTGDNAERVRQIFAEMEAAGAVSLNTAFAIAEQSQSFTWDQGVALLKVALLDLGQVVLPIVSVAIKEMIGGYIALREAVSAVSGFVAANATEFKIAAVAIAAFMIISALPGILLAVGSALTVATGRLVAWRLALIASSAAGFGGFLATLATSFVRAGQAAAGASVAVKAFTISLLTNPIFIAVAALTALGAALYYVSQNTEEARHAQALQAEQQKVLGETTAMVEKHAEALAAATDASRVAAIKAAQSDATRIRSLIERERQLIRTAQAELALAQATAAKRQEAVIAAMRSSRGAGGGSDPGMIAINRAQPANDEVARQQREYDTRVATLKGQASELKNLEGLIRGYTAPVVGGGSPPPAAGRGGGTNGAASGRAGGVSDAEREEKRMREAIESTVEALRLQTAQYGQSAEQIEFTSNVHRAGIKVLEDEYGTIEKALQITDAQAAGSTRLKGIREVAKATLEEQTAAQKEANRQDDIEQFAMLRLVDTARLSARARAIETAAIEAQTEAKRKGTVYDDKRTRDDAANKFDSDMAISNIEATKTFDDAIAVIDAHSRALSYNSRQSAIYVAGEEARIKATREGNTAVAEAVEQAQALAMARYDLENHKRTAQEGLVNWMDDLRNNTMSVGDLVYESLGATMGALSSVFDSFFAGQKVGWRELARGVVSSIGKMIVQMLLMKAVMAGLKLFGFADGGTFGGTGKVLASQAVNTGVIKAAQGAAFFASGGSFTNQVVDAITAFQFNEGNQRKLGVMGEAGPEAIMPLIRNGNAMAIAAYAEDGTRKALSLKRGPGGALGVQLPGNHMFARGGAFGGRIAPVSPSGASLQGGRSEINITVHVEKGTTTTTSSSGGDTASKLGALVAAAVQQELVKQKRPGGLLSGV